MGEFFSVPSAKKLFVWAVGGKKRVPIRLACLEWNEKLFFPLLIIVFIFIIIIMVSLVPACLGRLCPRGISEAQNYGQPQDNRMLEGQVHINKSPIHTPKTTLHPSSQPKWLFILCATSPCRIQSPPCISPQSPPRKPQPPSGSQPKWLFLHTPRTFFYEMGILCHYKMLLPDPIL